jgi:hypothetical protein
VKSLDLQSEAYQPTGSISADGIKNQLGRPRFDRLTLLAREAVQNSWDARIAEGNVLFGLAGWELTDKQQQWLLDTAFRKTPSDGLTLRDKLGSAKPATVLAIYDRGTYGLTGPTRADAVGPKDHANFVNLLRNVGQPPTAFRGGGTYGFGKTALFLASQVRTIVVHSQVAVGRKFEQRLMAASLGSQYTKKSVRGSAKRFTGRHWWGRMGARNVVDPLIGREAYDAARALGLPPFEKDETGTTILIVMPDFDGRAPEDALRFIGSAILRSFWPKMVDGVRSAPTMAFELSWNHSKIAMPRPQDVPPLDGFIKAFANLQAHRAGKKIPHPPASLHEVTSQKPIKRLGTLSLVRFAPSPRLAQAGTSPDDDGGPFTGPSRHTALMRGPHFVVNYVEGPPVPYEHAEYAGVFIASDDAEEAFARSEPPTHDDWSPDMLDDRNEKIFVRVAVRRVREAMQEFTGAPTIPRGTDGAVPLGAFSDLLGGLIPAELGTGARSTGSIGGAALDGGGNGTSRLAEGGATAGNRNAFAARVRVLEVSEPEAVSGVPVFTVRFDLEPSVRSKVVVVTASPMVVLEEGSVETEPPVGSLPPRVLFWSKDAGGVVGKAEELEIGPDDQGPWRVAVAMPSDAAVAVELTAKEHK